MNAYEFMPLVERLARGLEYAASSIADAVKYHGEMTVIASRLHESYEAERAADAIIRKHVP